MSTIGIGPGNGPQSTSAGPRRRCLHFIVWAQDGVVFMEDQRDGEIHVLTLSRAKHRRDAIRDEADIWDKRREGSADAKKSAHARTMFHELGNMTRVLTETIRDAEDQGDYENPEVREKKLVAFRRSRSTALYLDGRPVGGDYHAQPSALVFPANYGGPTVFHTFGIPPSKTGGRPVAVDPGAIPLYPRKDQ